MSVPACARRARVLFPFLALALASAAQANQSGDGIWTDARTADVQRSAQIAPRAVMPKAYRSLRIDQAALDRALSFAPAEAVMRVADSAVTLQLPLPDGRFESFRIVESPVMAPELAARYPQIRSWLGQGIDDPTATVRLDRSHKGFHAQIISWRGTVLIDPLAPGDREFAMVYHKRDAQLQGERPVCLLTGDELPQDLPDFSKRGVVPKLASGETLRTHRLAMAATGEYTQFHGGTVADGLAAINTTMNRVNGIYERDLAVRMELIPNNDLIIYTNGATDPYSNNDGFAMLGQNQTNLNNVIGNANFDIGHVVSTGGGGVASLGSVCSTNNKARGVTGLPSPIGDVFDVDFVAHEIGHQYRGNHTFNGSGSNCSGGNRNASTAYEPGSGVTIQAYAGICGADNLQSNSESYFHRISLDEMLSFVNTGGGSNCGTTSATGNTPPVVSTAAAFTIPQLTPFQLTAEGSDADGDTLTYIWEQFDLGAANPAGTLVDNGSRPIFRNFIPTLEPTRIFPSLRYILNNANNVPATAPLPGTTSPNRFTGEVLPSTNRTMNFRVTARDNRPGAGGTDDALTQITVSTAAGPFRVTSPNTAVSWAADSEQTITWDVAGTDMAPVNTSEVVIAFSIDGGLSFPIVSAPVPNTGSADFIIPNFAGTTRARVRVSAVDNVYFDISDVDFEITGPNTEPEIDVNGSINTAQGSPTATGPVATISDVQDAAGDLIVSIEGNPPELAVSVANDDGEVSLSATAECTLVAPTNGSRVYPLTLRVVDTDGSVSVAQVLVNVSRNQTPTLGSYADVNLAAGGSAQVSPSAAPADANNNLVGSSVLPTNLPGGGTVSIDGAGVVTINVGGATPDGDYPIRATVFDSCGAQETREFTVSISDALFADGFE
jgi:hypothetical protein